MVAPLWPRCLGQLLFAVVGLAAAGGAAASDTVDLSRALGLARGLVKVEVSGSDGRRSVGTGTVVAPERVVTACHVVQRADRIHVLHGGERRLVRRERADVDHDLCLLDVPGLDALPLPIGRAAHLVVGAPVLAIGFTGGVGLSPAIGVVEQLHSLDGAPVVQCDAGFSSGASGGALFDERGALVGILMFRQRGPGPRFFAVPVEWFEARIDQGEAYHPVGPLSGVPFWARPSEALPRFLQASNLSAEGRWADLRRFAREWRDAEGRDAEGAYWEGVAADQLRQDDEAIAAYQDAVALDARHAPSWYRLGQVYLRLGMAEKARALLPALIAASEPLGHRLLQDLAELPGA